MDQHRALGHLLSDYQDHRVSRRGFMKQALVLGLSMPAISGLLATSAASAAPARQEPKVGGTLREGYDLDFSRMDPINTSWYDPGFFALYDALLTSDPDGGLVPQLAESWTVSEDGLTVTFTLRTGAMFHSGRPLNAAAVKEVFDTIKDPNGGASLGVLFAPVESIEAPDEVTVILHMTTPYFEVLNVVKTGYWRIVNIQKRTELGAEYGQQVIDGSGPFTFEEWVPGSHVSVKRWEEYPGSIVPYFENKGAAYLEGIRWEAILEASQRALRLENNEIDTLHAPAFQDVGRLQGNSDLNVIALKEWSGYIFGVNHTRTQLDFQDVKMRQAISHAIDRATIAEALLFGQGEPLYGPINSADLNYTPEVEQYNQFDLDLAKSLVAELGWTAGDDGILTKNGTRMEFVMPVQAGTENQELGSVVQAQLKELGMDVKVEVYDRGTYFQKLGDNPDSYLFYYLWPVPIDVVTLFVGTATIPNPNWAQASIPEVDAAIEAWRSAPNAEALTAAGHQFQLAVAKNLPTIPLINRNNVWVNRKSVHGWLPHQWNLYPYYNDVWIE